MMKFLLFTSKTNCIPSTNHLVAILRNWIYLWSKLLVNIIWIELLFATFTYTFHWVKSLQFPLISKYTFIFFFIVFEQLCLTGTFFFLVFFWTIPTFKRYSHIRFVLLLLNMHNLSSGEFDYCINMSVFMRWLLLLGHIAYTHVCDIPCDRNKERR